MTWRNNFVSKIYRKLRRRWSRKEPVRLQSAASSPAPLGKEAPRIEPLEGRIAPATLVNPSMLTYVAIVKIEVGAVFNSQIFAGYDVSGTPVNPDAQIGDVKINGDWTACSIVVGVADVAGDGFGNGDDVAIRGGDNARIFSRIANVIIAGTVSGKSVPDDNFGFVAQQIGAFKAGAIRLALDGAANEQALPVSPGTGGDVVVREVPLLVT